MTRATEGERAALSSSLKGMLSLHDSAASPTTLHGSRGVLASGRHLTMCAPSPTTGTTHHTRHEQTTDIHAQYHPCTMRNHANAPLWASHDHGSVAAAVDLPPHELHEELQLEHARARVGARHALGASDAPGWNILSGGPA